MGFQIGQHGGPVDIALVVLDDGIFRCAIFSDGDRFQLGPIHLESLVFFLSKDDRLPVLQEKDVVIAHFAVGVLLVNLVVEDVAIL